MRKPVAVMASIFFDSEDVPRTLPLVICDDGAVFLALPEPDQLGREWVKLASVPGTRNDPAMRGYDGAEKGDI